MSLARAMGLVGVALLWPAAPAGAQCGINMTCDPSDSPSGSGVADFFAAPAPPSGSGVADFFAAPAPPSGSGVPGFGLCGINMTCDPSDSPARRDFTPSGFDPPSGSRPDFFTPNGFDPPSGSGVPGFGLCGINMTCDPPGSPARRDFTPNDFASPAPWSLKPTANAHLPDVPAHCQDDVSQCVAESTPWGSDTLPPIIFGGIGAYLGSPAGPTGGILGAGIGTFIGTEFSKGIHTYIKQQCILEHCPSTWSQREQQRQRQRASEWRSPPPREYGRRRP